MRVVFRVFVSGNDISESYVFVTDVFRRLCLWMQIFHIWSKASISLSPKVGLSQLEVFSCEGHVFMNFEIVRVIVSKAFLCCHVTQFRENYT